MLIYPQKAVAFLIIITLSVTYVNYGRAQESIHLLENSYFQPSPADNHEEGLYGVALAELSDIKDLDKDIILLSKSSFELDETRSIDLLLESIARTNNDDEKNEIRLSIGNKYFERKDYKKAKQFYSQIEYYYLDEVFDQSVNFKLGYIALLDKDFENSAKYFEKVTDRIGNYTKDGYYYLGVNQYYLDQVDAAVKSFEKVENEARYKDLIPYYLTQIYFKDERYDEVIAYCENKLRQPQLRNRSQINKMLGLSYLAKQDERKALEYLDSYADDTPKLTENEFYQLGYLHYRLGDKNKAAEYLKQLAHQDSEVGQMANYLLGSISLNQDKKQEARSAFKQSSKLSYFADIQTESNFLYYKLAGDMGEDRTAINGLAAINSDDLHYKEAQQLLSELLVRSNDYETAIRTIENLEQKTPVLVTAYQSLCYDYGLQLMEDGDSKSALVLLKTAADTPGDKKITDQSLFWSGYLLDETEPEESNRYINKYLESGDKDFLFQSHYLLAYQKLQLEKYDAAKDKLELAVLSYKPQVHDKVVFNDAVTRLADLELVDNNYESALEYYELAIENEAEGADYISYQKALIYGVNNQPYEKLTTLEALIKSYPESEYTDDAYFEIGESFVALEKNNEAYKVFEAITDNFASSDYAPKSWMRMGLISYNQGDMEAALVAYEKGLQKSDNNEDQREALLAIEEIYLNELNNPDAFFSFLENEIGFKYEDITKDSISFQVAYESFKAGEYEKAITLFGDYKKKFNNGFFLDDAHYFEAESYVLIKQYGKGLKGYERVLQMTGSEYYDFALKKAALISYNHEQDFGKSYKYYDELVTHKGGKALEYYEAALYSAFIIQNDIGIEKYGRRVIEFDKASDESKGTAHFYMGKSFQRQGQMDDAILAYNEVARYLENNHAAEASYLVSQIFYNSGQLDSAEAQAFETTKRAVNYPVWVANSLILLGDIYRDKKDYLNSSAAYESVIENFKDDREVNASARQKLSALEVLIESESRVKDETEIEFSEPDSIGSK